MGHHLWFVVFHAIACRCQCRWDAPVQPVHAGSMIVTLSAVYIGSGVFCVPSVCISGVLSILRCRRICVKLLRNIPQSPDQTDRFHH
jgi:hypothetical protein